MTGPELRPDPLFAALDDAQLARLGRVVEPAQFAAGDYIFRAGGAARATYLLRDGRVVLEVRQPGRPVEPVETLEAGDVLGFSWLFPSGRWLFDARAATPVATLAFDAPALHALMDRDPRLGYLLMAELVRRLYTRLEHAHVQRLDIYRKEAHA